MNAAQVRAKARMAMKRREEEVETEETESGELNLVPYLDIVTNIMLFLLATITSGLLLGTINGALPEYASGPGGGGQNPDEEEPLQLVVAVTKPEILMFSLSGREGTLDAPRLKIPASQPGREYDYTKITAVSSEIVAKYWPDKPVLQIIDDKPVCKDKDGKALPQASCRPEKATEVFLMVDPEIPYQVVIGTMDALRQNKDGVILFPGVIFSSGIAGL